MKISMWMLHDFIADYVCGHNLDEAARCRDIRGVMPYLPEETLSPGHVLIASAADLKNTVLHDGTSLIICGDSEDYIPEDTQYIRLLPDISIPKAFSLVLNAFEEYTDWYERLRQELGGNPDLTRICEIGNELIGNYITLFDPELILLAYTALPPWMFSLILEKRQGPYFALTEGAYKAIVTSSEHIGDIGSERAVYSTDPTSGLRVLYMNIGPGRFDCRLCVGESERLFRESDAQLCEILAEVLVSALESNYLSSTDTKTVFRELLCEILLNNPYDERLLSRSLSVWQWTKGDSFFLLRVEKQNPEGLFISSDKYICSRLEDLLRDACSFMIDGRIICVARLSPGESVSTAASRLSAFIDGSGFIVGVSNEFDDISDIRQYNKEAAIAVTLGRVKQPLEWLHMFADYSFLHFYSHGTSVLPAIHYCDLGVRRLLEFRGLKVDYYNTLRVYLENDRNLLHTAKNLNIHRTTLFYRLGRIHEMISRDLDDPKTRLNMLFSFKLLELDDEMNGGKS